MDIQAILIEKATVVGHIDLSKYGKPTTFDKPAIKGGKDHVSKSDLDSLEHILDRLFAHYKIDITFTKHFRERINDARNKDQITIEELRSLFQKAYAKVGSKLPKMAGIEAVLVDIQSKINVPFTMNVDRNGGLELVSKTIMRKNNFMTTSPKIKVENIMGKTFSDFLTESGKILSKDEKINLITDKVYSNFSKRSTAISYGKRSNAKVNIDKLSKQVDIPKDKLDMIVGMAYMSCLGGKNDAKITITNMFNQI